MLKKIQNKLHIEWEKFSRRMYCRRYIKRLKNTTFTIISQNCWGGILSKDLGLPYNSPMVNLFMNAADFVSFCERMSYYLSLPLEECDRSGMENISYPVGRLGDLKLHFVHYKSFSECLEKWERRKGRINKDNIFLAMTDRDGCTVELIERFRQLPYPKVLFSHIPRPNYDFCVYIPGFESQGQVGMVTSIDRWTGRRVYERAFDPVKWLNQSSM